MNLSTATTLPLAHTSSNKRRTRASFFSSASDTGASFPLPTRLTLPGLCTRHMLPLGGLWRTDRGLIHPSAWKAGVLRRLLSPAEDVPLGGCVGPRRLLGW